MIWIFRTSTKYEKSIVYMRSYTYLYVRNVLFKKIHRYEIKCIIFFGQYVTTKSYSKNLNCFSIAYNGFDF